MVTLYGDEKPDKIDLDNQGKHILGAKIAFLRKGEPVPPGYRGLPPIPWAPFAWRRSPDALADWGTYPGRPHVAP